jgi:hypothetical protein
MKLEESNLVSSDLKRQLREQEEVLKSNKDEQKQLQTTIDDLTKTVESLNQRLQALCEPPKFVSTFKIPALTVGSVEYVRVSGTSDSNSSEDCTTAIIRVSFKRLFYDTDFYRQISVRVSHRLKL